VGMTIWLRNLSIYAPTTPYAW